jgi:DNA-binding MarR family transcriptional regulator
MSNAPATMTQECNCFAVRSAARHVTQFYDQHLASSGLRTTQFSILSRLKRNGPMTINRLAEEMAMDRTTLGRNILPLERDGLIRVEPAPNDRRAKELHLTAAGVKGQQTALKAWTEAQGQFEETFGPQRAAQLRGMLRAVVATDFAGSDRGQH